MQSSGETKRSKSRRQASIEKLLLDKQIVRAKVTEHDVILFLNSGTELKISLRSTDEGPLNYSWKSLDTIKTEDDYWK